LLDVVIGQILNVTTRSICADMLSDQPWGFASLSGFATILRFFARVVVMNLLLFLVAFGAGIAMSFQAAINSQMAAAVGANPVVAALVSFMCGTAALAVLACARGGLPDALAALPQQPLWKFSGGFLGAAFIFCTVMLVPRIGLLNLVVLVIAGQLLTSMAIDHFGLVEVAMRKVSLVRLAGAAVMILGVVLALFGDRIVQAVGR
jgi:bacterial/archaeal transporter family-2 protein